jgi:hypothetical protein
MTSHACSTGRLQAYSLAQEDKAYLRGSGADALLIGLGQSPAARATVLRRLRLPPWLAPLFVSAGDSENLDDLHCSPPAASSQDGFLIPILFLIRVVAVALGQ